MIQRVRCTLHSIPWRIRPVLFLVLILASLWTSSVHANNHSAPDPRDELLLQACGKGDPILHHAARVVAQRSLQDRPPWSMLELGQRLRMWGASYPGARAWTLRSPNVDRHVALARMKQWVASRSEGIPLRCGVASVLDSDKGEALTVITVPVFAVFQVPLPPTSPQGRWITVDVRMQEQADGAKIVVLGPRGVLCMISSSFDLMSRQVLGRFMVDREGVWVVQVLADLSKGPRPVIEKQVVVGANKSRQAIVPGEDAAENLSPAQSMFAKLNEARRLEGFVPLRSDATLQQIAQDHVHSMMAAGVIAHDVGNGPPHVRAAKVGMVANEIGENVSRAGNAKLAHRSLWDSPSHRSNMLHPRYERVGVAAMRDAKGVLWVAQVFAGRELDADAVLVR